MYGWMDRKGRMELAKGIGIGMEREEGNVEGEGEGEEGGGECKAGCRGRRERRGIKGV